MAPKELEYEKLDRVPLGERLRPDTWIGFKEFVKIYTETLLEKSSQR